MFGILRPCRHSLSEDLAREWMSHMCGLCLALRDEHGQTSRIATNYDGLVLSVLTAAQSEEHAGTRTAGRCPLRGMRGARVADGSGAHLAAAVSLMLASAKISDHIEDGTAPTPVPACAPSPDGWPPGGAAVHRRPGTGSVSRAVRWSPWSTGSGRPNSPPGRARTCSP